MYQFLVDNQQSRHLVQFLEKKRRILNFALIFKEQLHIKLHMVEKNFYDYCATDQN